MSAVPILVAAGVPHSIPIIEEPHSPKQTTSAIDRRAAFRSAMNAGIMAAILAAVPLKVLPLLGLLLAGGFSVFLYRRYSQTTEPTPSLGFRLGAWAGLVGFALFMLLEATLVLALHAQVVVHDQLVGVLRQAQSSYTDQQMRESAEHFMTGHGLMSFMIILSAFTSIIFAVLSGIGGAISAALLRRKLPPQ